MLFITISQFCEPMNWRHATYDLGEQLRGVLCAVWGDLAKFRHLGILLKDFGLFLSNYLVFGKIVNLLWQIFHTYGQIFIVLNGQILK